MRADPSLICPQCGGHEVKDLTRIRRGTGAVLMAGSLAGVAVAATASVPVPGWALPVACGVFVLGVATSLGAHRARYCPACNIRMEEKTGQ